MRLGVALGGAILVCVAVAATIGELMPPEAALRINMASRLSPPDATHLLGSDELGRDVLSRLLAGANTTVRLGLYSVIVAFCFGVPLGVAANKSPGWIGRLVVVLAHVSYVLPSWFLRPLWSSRVAVALLSAACLLPAALLALIAIAFLGAGHATNAIVLGVFMAPAVAYMMHRMDILPADHGQIAVGRARSRTLSLALLATSLFGWAILAGSALDAIGLGVQPPRPSWGIMLAELTHTGARLSWLSIIPGLCLVLTGLGAFLLGDAFQQRGQA
jgi:peptide/nickel transport system permease protein